jgi:hypothetical protein
LNLGDHAEARTRQTEALALARSLGDRELEGLAVGRLAELAASLGDYPEARARCTEALAIAREVRTLERSVRVIESIAVLVSMVGKHQQAVQLASCVHHLCLQTGLGRGRPATDRGDRILAAARAALDHDQHERAWDAGAHLTVDESLDFAETVLENLA